MLKRILLAAALVSGAVSVSPAQETKTWDVVRGWTIGIDTTIGNGCFIYSPYEDGLVFRLGYNPLNDTAYLLFGNPAWQSIETDKSYPVVLQMGRKAKWSGNATGGWIDGIPSLVVTSDDERFVIEIASQTTLKAWFGTTQIANISLKGTMAAIQEMLVCQEAANRVGGTSSDPFAD